MKKAWRLIDTGSLDPYSNMAFDEALLRGYEQYGSLPTLRIYGWKPAGISLGYSQDPEEVLDLEACRTRSMPFVRRLTGGGMIMHGEELTYSLVSSKEDLGIPSSVVSSYKTVASFLISFYKGLGIDAAFACDVTTDQKLGEPSRLCFAGKEKYDIVACGRKIGGNAQKRVKDIIFQHGSIPIRVDMKSSVAFLRGGSENAEKAGVASLEEMLGWSVSVKELSRRLARSFETAFNVKTEAGSLTEKEKEIFGELKAKKYESTYWNYGRIDRTTLVGK